MNSCCLFWFVVTGKGLTILGCVMEGDFTDLCDDVKAVKIVSKVHRCVMPVKQKGGKETISVFLFRAKNSNVGFPH